MKPTLLTSLLLAPLLLAPAAHADQTVTWVCLKAGQSPHFITNDEVALKNAKRDGKKCRVYFTSDGKPPRPKTSKRSGTNFKPPANAPRPVEESGSLDERMQLYDAYIREAAAKYGIPPSFVRAVIRVESAFRYRAVSSVGAKGLMQLMPGTARAMGVNDAFDPRQNIFGGTRLLRVLANKHGGDIVKVLSSYHAGSGAVAKKGGIPYEGTEGYVRAVLKHYYKFKDARAAQPQAASGG